MSNNLTDFLIQLGESPARLYEYQKDSDLVLKGAGLSKTERTAVLSADGHRLSKELAANGAMSAVIWVRPLEVLQIGAPA